MCGTWDRQKDWKEIWGWPADTGGKILAKLWLLPWWWLAKMSFLLWSSYLQSSYQHVLWDFYVVLLLFDDGVSGNYKAKIFSTESWSKVLDVIEVIYRRRSFPLSVCRVDYANLITPILKKIFQNLFDTICHQRSKEWRINIVCNI